MPLLFARIAVSFARLALFLISLLTAAAQAGPATLPSAPPTGIDARLWERMKAIDAKVDTIADLTATFEQQKFTPLLKKPLVSKGTVYARAAAMLWDTRSPEPTVMRVDEKEVAIYYPTQKTEEIYPLAGQMSAMASSPLPRLAVLLEHFRFSPGVAKDLGEVDRPNHLAFRLVPTDDAIREHVASVDVLIDTDRAVIVAFQLIDTDGERTLIHFTDVRVNTRLDDKRLQIDLPAGVKVVRPLENLGPPPAPARPAPK